MLKTTYNTKFKLPKKRKNKLNYYTVVGNKNKHQELK